MRVYFTAMTVRIACVASLFFVRGWWILLVGIAAVLLPYFAVIIANQAAPGVGTRPEPPTPLELHGSDASDAASDEADPSTVLLVVDDPAERRGSAPESDE